MSKEQQQQQKIDPDRVCAGSPYPKMAFVFVQEGLEYTVRSVHEEPEEREPGECHVTGTQLCQGLRDYAIKKYGLMARSVLEHWNILRTDDFGRIVFTLVDAGIWTRTDEDSIEEFYGVYRFDEAFNPDQVAEVLSASSSSSDTPN